MAKVSFWRTLVTIVFFCTGPYNFETHLHLVVRVWTVGTSMTLACHINPHIYIYKCIPIDPIVLYYKNVIQQNHWAFLKLSFALVRRLLFWWIDFMEFPGCHAPASKGAKLLKIHGSSTNHWDSRIRPAKNINLTPEMPTLKACSSNNRKRESNHNYTIHFHFIYIYIQYIGSMVYLTTFTMKSQLNVAPFHFLAVSCTPSGVLSSHTDVTMSSVLLQHLQRFMRSTPPQI